MDLPLLPQEVSYRLSIHQGEADAPVWVYRPMTYIERDAAFRQIRELAEDEIRLHGLPVPLCDAVVRGHLLRVEGLTVIGATFDPTCDAHWAALWTAHLDWLVALASAIIAQAQVDEGN